MQNVKCLVLFKLPRQVCNHLYLYLIKAAFKTLIFFKKLFFCIFEPKNRFVIENSSKTPLKPHSHCAGVATVHPDAGQPVYRDAPGHIS